MKVRKKGLGSTDALVPSSPASILHECRTVRFASASGEDLSKMQTMVDSVDVELNQSYPNSVFT